MKGRDLNERCMLEQWVLLRPLLTLWQEASPLLFGKFSSGPSLNSCCPVRPAAASQAAPRLAVTFAMSRPMERVQRRVCHSQRVKLHWVFLFCLSAEHLRGGKEICTLFPLLFNHYVGDGWNTSCCVDVTDSFYIWFVFVNPNSRSYVMPMSGLCWLSLLALLAC